MSRKEWSPRGVVCAVRVVRALDEDPDLSYLATSVEEYMRRGETSRDARRYAEEDRERLESHGRSWHMLCVRAEAVVLAAGREETVSSPGVCGVESLDEAGVREFEREEVEELKRELGRRGIRCREVDVVRLEH